MRIGSPIIVVSYSFVSWSCTSFGDLPASLVILTNTKRPPGIISLIDTFDA